MEVAVVGTGNIGGTVGRALARAGHDVTFGSRNPDAGQVSGDTGARIAPIGDAVVDAGVVIIAIPGGAVQQFVHQFAAALAGKLVVDAANNLGGEVAHSHSAVVEAVPTARYTRAFNSLGVENLENPTFGSTQADMFFSAAMADRATVESLIEAVGLRPVWVGDGMHEVVDGVLRLWFALSRERGRHLGFRVLDNSDR